MNALLSLHICTFFSKVQTARSTTATSRARTRRLIILAAVHLRENILQNYSTNAVSLYDKGLVDGTDIRFTGNEFTNVFAYHIILDQDCKIAHVGEALLCAFVA